jgi:hypothetical protein
MKQLPLLILAFVLFSAAAFGYWYLNTEIGKYAALIAASQTNNQSASAREAFNRSANEFLFETSSVRAEASAFVAQDADFVSVIETVEAAARREGVAVEVGSVNVSAGGLKSHELVALTLSAKGGFTDVVAFVSALEALPFASRVNAVSLELSEKGWFARATLEFVKRKSSP